MITLWGEGRGFRVVWLLEEMGLDYRLRDVDLLAGVENDAEFLAVNPSGFIPAITDGEVTMVESVAIMEYLLARHGPSPLAVEPGAPDYPVYLQFLHMGEAGLMGASYWLCNALHYPTEAERNNPTVRHARYQYHNRLALVTRQLEKTPYVAGEHFTAADISVAYAIEHAEMASAILPGEIDGAYLERIRARDGYKRAMDACPAIKAWFERVRSARA
jgi:glutathione S-transferase